ncbi:MAG: glycine cleavage system protein R [Chromatiales bacterium]|nr:glycine cleavage system protein R [Chromatiales bacterium]
MSTPNSRSRLKTYLVVSALGPDRPGIVERLTRVIDESGCMVRDSRMTNLGQEFAMQLVVEGNWNNIAMLETALPSLEKRQELTLQFKRTELRPPAENLLPYGVEAVSVQQPGIVHHLAEFFSSRGINISELVTNTYSASTTGTPMFTVQLTINVPADIQIAGLREEFMDFCDRLNLDAVLEPVKY